MRGKSVTLHPVLLGQAQLAELCQTDNPRRELILAVWSCSVSLVFL